MLSQYQQIQLGLHGNSTLDERGRGIPTPASTRVQGKVARPTKSTNRPMGQISEQDTRVAEKSMVSWLPLDLGDGKLGPR